ncbi:MAG: phosphate acyltransferase PlsX [Planctomycetota bacterium]
MRIAIDAMGGDHAPSEVLRGVALAIALGHVAPEHLVLVGDEARLEAGMRQHAELAGVPVQHASQVAEMGEKAAGAVRHKRDSSIMRAVELLPAGMAQAMISAGDTAVVVGCAILKLGLLPGVRRPGIAITVHGASGPCVILDVGANIHCKPQHLFQYGFMGALFCKDMHGIENPRIGLLNIGAEESKGNELVRQTHALFESSALNFIGNVEGQDIFSGRCDVIVCEGFVGNVVLKVAEGLGSYVRQAFCAARQEILEHSGRPGEVANDLDRLIKRFDYAEYGGAPLLGVDGLVMICHGRSDARAISNALRVSRSFVEADVNQHIRTTLSAQAGSGSGGGGVPCHDSPT